MIISAVLLYLSSILMLFYVADHTYPFFLSGLDVCRIFLVINFILALIIAYNVISKKYNIKFFTKLKKFILNEWCFIDLEKSYIRKL